MRTRTLPQHLPLALAGIAFVLMASAARLDDNVLLKIERVQPVPLAADVLDEVEGVQELASGWIAAAPAALASRLHAAGAAVSVLDAAPVGKHYFLVFGAAAPDVPSLRSLGVVTEIEPGVILLASREEDLRPGLPARFSLAPLALSPVALVHPVFQTAGRPRAVPRAGAAAVLGAADPRIALAAGNVSRDAIAETIRTLESYQTRYATTTNLVAAGNYLFDQFRRAGLQVEYDDFTFTTANYPASNIVATIPGRVSPHDVVILCAHYDSTSDQRPALAPGADDNASGTATVLEAGRVLAGIPFDFTVRLIAFSAEEWGLYGSRHYAQAARSRGDRIVAAVNLDMVGFVDRVPEDLDVTGNEASQWLVEHFAAASALYAPLPVLKKVNASSRSSDHAPFLDQGYSAVECIEDEPLKNPYYHRITDRFTTLDMAFVESVARAAVAVTATLAQPVSVQPPPTGLTFTSETIRSLFLRARRTVLQWAPAAGASGYNVYRASTSHGPYRRLNASPVAAASYADDFVPLASSAFYVVTAVDAQARESNYSGEVVVQ